MKMFRPALTAVVSLVSIAALAQEKPRGTQLKSTDLARTFESGTIAIGDSFVFATSYAQLYLRGGVLHWFYSDPDGNGNYVQGTWRIHQDTLCTAQSAGMWRGEQCNTVYKLADGSYESWFEGKRVEAFRLKRAANSKPAG
jgi:hypothetical protein